MDTNGMNVLGYRAITVGSPLLEVFSVTVSKVGVDRRSEIYGTIRVTDGRGTDAALYNRVLQNSEPINPNQTLTLMRPPRGISAFTSFSIDIDLKDKNENLEISKGKVILGIDDEPYYDKLLTINVPGKQGLATVHCGLFRVALEAFVDVELIREDTMPPFTEFHGTVVARYGRKVDLSSGNKEKFFSTELFNRSRNNCVKVEPGKPIQLPRSVVCVPAESSLVIVADLFVGDSDGKRFTGFTEELLPNQTMSFVIQGKGLRAEVQVVWNQPTDEEDFE